MADSSGLDHGVRRRLLRRLNESGKEPLGAVALAELLGEPLSAVSYHVAVLRSCGAIEVAGTRQRRGAVELLYVSKVAGDAAVQAVLEETRAEDEGCRSSHPERG